MRRVVGDGDGREGGRRRARSRGLQGDGRGRRHAHRRQRRRAHRPAVRRQRSRRPGNRLLGRRRPAGPVLEWRKPRGSSSAVERKLPKLDVAGSIPVSRSIHIPTGQAPKAKALEATGGPNSRTYDSCDISGNPNQEIRRRTRWFADGRPWRSLAVSSPCARRGCFSAGAALESRGVRGSLRQANNSGNLNGGVELQPGGYVATSVLLRTMIAHAYQLKRSQVVGGPVGSMPIGSTSRRRRRRGCPTIRNLRWPGRSSPIVSSSRHMSKRDEAPIYRLVKRRADGRLGPKLKRATAECSGSDPSPTPISGAGPIASAGKSVRPVFDKLRRPRGRHYHKAREHWCPRIDVRWHARSQCR